MCTIIVFCFLGGAFVFASFFRIRRIRSVGLTGMEFWISAIGLSDSGHEACTII
jgi:hypothetical protein